MTQAQGNHLSVLQELQADCFAGYGGSQSATSTVSEAGDIDEAINAAGQIAMIVAQASGRAATPDSFAMMPVNSAWIGSLVALRVVMCNLAILSAVLCNG